MKHYLGFCFEMDVLECSSGSSGTCYVVQATFELTEICSLPPECNYAQQLYPFNVPTLVY